MVGDMIMLRDGTASETLSIVMLFDSYHRFSFYVCLNTPSFFFPFFFFFLFLDGGLYLLSWIITREFLSSGFLFSALSLKTTQLRTGLNSRRPFFFFFSCKDRHPITAYRLNRLWVAVK